MCDCMPARGGELLKWPNMRSGHRGVANTSSVTSPAIVAASRA